MHTLKKLWQIGWKLQRQIWDFIRRARRNISYGQIWVSDHGKLNKTMSNQFWQWQTPGNWNRPSACFGATAIATAVALVVCCRLSLTCRHFYRASHGRKSGICRTEYSLFHGRSFSRPQICYCGAMYWMYMRHQCSPVNVLCVLVFSETDIIYSYVWRCTYHKHRW